MTWKTATSDAVKHFERVVAIDASDPRAWDYLALNIEIVGRSGPVASEPTERLRPSINVGPLDAFLDYNYGMVSDEKATSSKKPRAPGSRRGADPKRPAVWLRNAPK